MRIVFWVMYGWASVALGAPPKLEPIAVQVPKRTQPVSFAKEVTEILDAKCVACHSGSVAENKLVLEDVPSMLKGGKHGPAIVAGNAGSSLLFKMAAHLVEPAMPPVEKKDHKPLTPEELGVLKLWIDAGAKDDSAEYERANTPIELGILPPGVQPINALQMTSDGRRVASGRANVVQVHDIDSGLEIITLGGHQDLIQSLRLSPNGKYLAAGVYQSVIVWNVPNGREVKTIEGHGDQVKSVVVSGDRKTIVSASLDGSFRVLDAASGNQIARVNPAPGAVLAVAISDDGKTIASGGNDGIVRLFSLPDAKPKGTLKGHTGPINALSFSRDAGILVSGSTDATARVWKVPAANGQTTDPIVLSGHPGPVFSVAISPDGQEVFTGGQDGIVRVWHAIDARIRMEWKGHSGPVLALALAPNGSLVLSGSAYKTARLIDRLNGTLVREFKGHAGAVNAVAFNPAGDELATADALGGVKVWKTATGQGVFAFGHTDANAQLAAIHAVAFLGDHSFITASANKTLKTWSYEGEWSELTRFEGHVFRVLALDFSADSGLLATGGGEPSRSGEVKVWTLPKPALVWAKDSIHSDTVFGLRFSPDGTRLATVAADKFLKVSSAADGKLLKTYEGHTGHVLGVDWKADGKQLVSAGADNVIKLWDYESGDQLRTFQPAGKPITSLEWLAGTQFVLGASGDKLARIWNADNGGIQTNLNGATDYIFSVSSSGGGPATPMSRIAAGCADGVLLVWRRDNAQIVRKLDPPAGTGRK